MPKLSIIIPIYNAENSLARCLESILNQSFSDYELLLVNDGSTDSSLRLCQQYAEVDKRILVIDKVNGGVSSARNAGLDTACGDWITFIDSDDWIGDDYCSILNIEPQIDIIIGSVFFNNDQTFGTLRNDDTIIDDSSLRIIVQDEYNHSLLNSPCAKFYRNDIISKNKIRFDEALLFGEDAVFVKTYLLYINSMQVYNKAVYYYDDIGDEIYRKYNKSFLPIFDYYIKMSDLYASLENRYQIYLSKHDLVGVTYNLLIQCIKKSTLKEWTIIKQYLNVSDVKAVLRKRNSLHINILLCLATFPKGFLFILYFHIIEKLKPLRK